MLYCTVLYYTGNTQGGDDLVYEQGLNLGDLRHILELALGEVPPAAAIVTILPNVTILFTITFCC